MYRSQTETAPGITFLRYPWFQQDELGIWTAPNGDKVAWFNDPDGNVLSISQHEPHATAPPHAKEVPRGAGLLRK